VDRARAVAASPFIEVTAVETRLGTRFTFDTVAALRSRYPFVRFVFLMGADNLAEFHRWHRWRELAGLIPFAVIDRAGWSFRALAAPAAAALAEDRLPESEALRLLSAPLPAWVFLHGVKSSQSSTALRLSRTEG
jgi:nicotinate-nucleotide adenylyltransferase